MSHSRSQSSSQLPMYPSLHSTTQSMATITATTSMTSSAIADILQTTLATLRHLDLTGRVVNDSSVNAFGGYCDVFVGHYDLPEGGVKKVAVKRLRVHILQDRNFAKMLAKEIRVWSRLHHPNIIPFLGYVLEGNGCPSLISEWMENGTALNYLKNHAEYDVVSLILGIAKGLSYLHERGIIHSDIKADNVLISQSGTPLICDFGISRMLAASQTFGATSNQTGGLRGTTRWMAIELLQLSDSPKTHSKESDVWAFGMTVYEFMTKTLPYAEYKQDVQVMFAIANGVLPSTPSDVESWDLSNQSLWRLCLQCWERDPLQRPPMATVVNMIRLVTPDSPDDDQGVPGIFLMGANGLITSDRPELTDETQEALPAIQLVPGRVAEDEPTPEISAPDLASYPDLASFLHALDASRQKRTGSIRSTKSLSPFRRSWRDDPPTPFNGGGSAARGEARLAEDETDRDIPVHTTPSPVNSRRKYDGRPSALEYSGNSPFVSRPRSSWTASTKGFVSGFLKASGY